MADHKTLACVGLNGFDRARLRLLLGEAGQRLDVSWRLGPPETADLLLLAEGSAEAEAAGMLARGRGVRCVRVGGAGANGEITLSAGFNVDDLVGVLSVALAPVAGFRSTEPAAPAIDDEPAADAQASRIRSREMEAGEGIPEAVDLERYLSGDRPEYSPDAMPAHALQEDAVVESIEHASAAVPDRVGGMDRHPYARHEASTSVATREPLPTVRAEPAVARPLLDYLDGERLVAPVQLVLDGAEPLILDPKNRIYLIAGDLASAEPYARRLFVEAEFERLTTRELERWRALCQPQPFERLQWLLALRRGDGWLPRHLDPGGNYRLCCRLDLDAHFDDQNRIGNALGNWHPLHEVAAHSGADMQSVFNTVAAYDAIGWLEIQPRKRFRR